MRIDIEPDATPEADTLDIPPMLMIVGDDPNAMAFDHLIIDFAPETTEETTAFAEEVAARAVRVEEYARHVAGNWPIVHRHRPTD